MTETSYQSQWLDLGFLSADLPNPKRASSFSTPDSFLPSLFKPAESISFEETSAAVEENDQKNDDKALKILFQKARKGDVRASDLFCRQMRPRLFRMAFAYLKDAAEADDVVQETLMRALTKTFLFLGKGSLIGWLLRIAQNLSKNKLRNQKRRQEILHDATGLELSSRGALATSIKSPDRILEEKESMVVLEQALAKLSPRQAEVVRLRLTAELSFKEIAVLLLMREANARVTFHQAKEKLLTELRTLQKDEDHPQKSARETL